MHEKKQPKFVFQFNGIGHYYYYLLNPFFSAFWYLMVIKSNTYSYTLYISYTSLHTCIIFICFSSQFREFKEGRDFGSSARTIVQAEDLIQANIWWMAHNAEIVEQWLRDQAGEQEQDSLMPSVVVRVVPLMSFKDKV